MLDIEKEIPGIVSIIPTKQYLANFRYYPYFLREEKYAAICSYHVMKKTEKQKTFIVNTLKARAELEMELNTFEKAKNIPSIDISKLSIYNECREMDSTLKESLKVLIKNYQSYTNAVHDLFLSKPLCGCKEFFELKQKYGLIPQ